MKSNTAAIKLVCFDLGGVLIRICRSWHEGCANAGLEIRGDWVNGEPDVTDWPMLREQLQTGLIDRDAYAAQLSRAMNGLYQPHEICSIHTAWLLGEYEGVAEVIDDIYAAGVATASLSNTDHVHWEQMQSLPVLMRLQHKWASHLLNLQKPDVAIYRTFEERVGVKGGSILFFDDLAENTRAAQDVGWNTVHIDPMSPTDVQIRRALTEFRVIPVRR